MFTVATQAETASAPATPNTPFHKLGGHATMQAICNRFYDLMDSDPAYAELRAMHAADLAPMRKSLPLFLAGWAGGPRDWFEQNPGRCMMSVHKPFVINRAVAAQWGEAMKRAIAHVAPAEAELAKAMGGVLEDMALGMGRD
jgi:hemoglobin